MIFSLKKNVSLYEILSILKIDVKNFLNFAISCVASAENIEDGCIAFSLDPDKLNKSNIYVLIAKEKPPNFNGVLIQSSNPKLDFVNILSWLDKNIGFYSNQVSVISDSAKVHNSAVVMDGVSVGDNSEIGPNVVLMSGVKVGKNTKIGAGTVLGDDGFGYVRGEEYRIDKFVHLGGVIVGDYVDIGNNCTIDRGSLSDTVIEDSVKIDNLVHVAHGVRIGNRTMVAASAEISGSVIIGSDVWIGPGSVIINGIEIESMAVIGLGAVVTRSIRKHEKVFGNPARTLPD
jgi:acetyltransferase-like isoleucine patch superfamily enzyme